MLCKFLAFLRLATACPTSPGSGMITFAHFVGPVMSPSPAQILTSLSKFLKQMPGGGSRQEGRPTTQRPLRTLLRGGRFSPDAFFQSPIKWKHKLISQYVFQQIKIKIMKRRRKKGEGKSRRNNICVSSTVQHIINTYKWWYNYCSIAVLCYWDSLVILQHFLSVLC